MRILPSLLVGFAVLAGPSAGAQAQQLPSTSSSEQEVNSLNAAMGRELRQLGTTEQNQFEVNQMQRSLTDQSVSGPPPVGIGTSSRICPPGATAC